MAWEAIAMRTTIDKLGRIVVHKEMRKYFGLVPGTQVEDGVLVFDGKVAGNITSWVRKSREDRNLKIASII